MSIAITGGVAEGKSTVLNLLREDGWVVSSSDDIARSAFSDPDVNRRLASLAGAGESVSPAQLREAMLASNEVRRSVNRYLHPLIRKRQEESGAAFQEVPLLFEACLYQCYDQVWTVTCGPEVQRSRLLARYADEALVERLLAVQLPTCVKIAFSDRVVRTNCPLEAVRSTLRLAVRES